MLSFQVQNVSLVPISTDSVALDAIDLRPCPKHQPSWGEVSKKQTHFESAHFSFSSESSDPSVPNESARAPPASSSPPSTSTNRIFPLRATADAVKASADAVKASAGSAAAALASQVKKAGKNAAPAPAVLTSGPNVSRELERFERRMLEEFSRMFNDSESFYFSPTGDITNSLQRQTKGTERGELEVEQVSKEGGEDEEEAVGWRRADDRFFFNRHLIQELIDLDDDGADPFILPMIQGFVELRKAQLKLFDDAPPHPQEGDPDAGGGLPSFYTVALVSRRCRHRAGTRYNRRGVDDDGWVGNAVETEQILLYHHYALSFVVTRGSVPLFWSQPGYKYRPPVRLDRTEEEDRDAFRKHIRREMGIYGKPVRGLFPEIQ